MLLIRKIIIILTATFPFFAQSFAQANLKQTHKLETIMDQVLADRFKSGGPGGVILVAKEGKVIYKRACGMADLESGIPLNPNHVFRIASLTKQFTAISILQLMEQGKLNLDDRVKRFIPDYPHGDSITIAHLLSHTSGIKNITEIENDGKCITANPISPTELLNTFKNIPLDFQPGSDFHYSNSGYIVLGYIIEKISGLSYEDYIKQHIFKLVGMKNAFFDHPDKIIKNRVRGYDNITDSSWKNADYINPSGAYSAGALMMTIEDLYKWHRHLFNHKVVKKETLQKAITPVTLAGGQKINYGFGVGLEPLDGSPAIQHSGSINGFASFEIYLPEDNVYVAFFSNANKNVIGPAVLAAGIAAGKSIVREIFPKDKTLNQYVGTYQYPENGRSLFISKREGKLYFHDRRFSKKPWQMHFRTDKSFICYEAFPNDYVFNIDLNGKPSGINIGIADMSLTLKKIQ